MSYDKRIMMLFNYFEISLNLNLKVTENMCKDPISSLFRIHFSVAEAFKSKLEHNAPLPLNIQCVFLM